MAFIGHIAHYGRTEMLNFSCDEFLEVHKVCLRLAEQIYKIPWRL